MRKSDGEMLVSHLAEEPLDQSKWLLNKIRQVEDDDLRTILTILLGRCDYLELTIEKVLREKP